MKRGDIVITVLAGDYGKPRPAVIVQSNILKDLNSVLVCPLTSEITTTGPARVEIDPSEINGLTKRSLVMVDKVTAVSRARCHQAIGQLTAAEQAQLNSKLITVLGLNDPA